jgi:hypothetical protein
MILCHTRPDRRHPCQPVVDQCTCADCQTNFPIRTIYEAQPARDFKGRAKDLRSYEFRHLDAANSTVVSDVCRKIRGTEEV